jgi:hypothetical protein
MAGFVDDEKKGWMTVVLFGCRSGLVWMSRCFGKGGECHLGVELHVFAMARDFHVEGSEWKSFVLLASLADLRPKIVVLDCSTLRVSVAPCVSLHHHRWCLSLVLPPVDRNRQSTSINHTRDFFV